MCEQIFNQNDLQLSIKMMKEEKSKWMMMMMMIVGYDDGDNDDDDSLYVRMDVKIDSPLDRRKVWKE